MPPRNGLPKWIYVQYRSNSNNTTELRLGRIFDDEPWLTILHKKMISCHILNRSVRILKHQQDSNWSFNFHDKWDIYISSIMGVSIYLTPTTHVYIYIYLSIWEGRSFFLRQDVRPGVIGRLCWRQCVIGRRARSATARWAKMVGFLKWGYPQIMKCHRIFHCKPSSYWGTTILGNLHIYIMDYSELDIGTNWQGVSYLSYKVGLPGMFVGLWPI